MRIVIFIILNENISFVSIFHMCVYFLKMLVSHIAWGGGLVVEDFCDQSFSMLRNKLEMRHYWGSNGQVYLA